VVGATRPGYDLEHARSAIAASTHHFDVTYLEVPALAISSSYLRDRVVAGQSLRYLTPDQVTGYIHKHHLYGVRPRRYGASEIAETDSIGKGEADE
jgi:nicotinate-nucleotide adenylyltransferase